MSEPSAFAGTIESLQFAAEDGHLESMFLLGVAYAQGKGIERDDSAAARWFHLAARRGHVRARTSLGFLYSVGRGVRRDLVLAYVLLDQAAGEGDALASDLMIRLRRQMTPPQLRDAERRRKR
jgi:TPR repeat protein